MVQWFKWYKTNDVFKLQNVDKHSRNSHKLKFSTKSLTFSCLVYAPNLYFAQGLFMKALLEPQKLLESCQSGQAWLCDTKFAHVGNPSGFKANTHEAFCSRGTHRDQFARLVHTGEHSVGGWCSIVWYTHEGAFSSLFNLPQNLASKYLTIQITPGFGNPSRSKHSQSCAGLSRFRP